MVWSSSGCFTVHIWWKIGASLVFGIHFLCDIYITDGLRSFQDIKNSVNLQAHLSSFIYSFGQLSRCMMYHGSTLCPYSRAASWAVTKTGSKWHDVHLIPVFGWSFDWGMVWASLFSHFFWGWEDGAKLCYYVSLTGMSRCVWWLYIVCIYFFE